MPPLFESFGIAREPHRAGTHARNTVENAVLTKALVKPKPGERWLLVTSAHHMPRSVGVFRQAGFPVEAYPVDWISTGDGLWPAWLVGILRRRIAAIDMPRMNGSAV